MSPRARRSSPPVDAAELESWFREHIPAEWFTNLEVQVDDDEILVLGVLQESSATANDATISAFREDTRQERIEIAAVAEARWRRKVAWGARCGDTGMIFTHLAIPAMTRLRFNERRVLDTLVESGVARSRADALAWCVRLVGTNLNDWLADLQGALDQVDEVRKRGPGL